jgi:hypothetical protein
MDAINLTIAALFWQVVSLFYGRKGWLWKSLAAFTVTMGLCYAMQLWPVHQEQPSVKSQPAAANAGEKPQEAANAGEKPQESDSDHEYKVLLQTFKEAQ